jgi:RNA polymerase sigma factor (sigma-70 family)
MGVQVRNETQDEDLVRLYLDSIGRYPLLTKEQEWDLSRLIYEGREAKEQVSKVGLKTARQRQLLSAVELGEAATEQFINANLRLVVSIAKRYQSSELPLLDLVQEGNLGLIHAVSKFDWRKGFKFSTYATWWIKQAISRGIDNTGRTIRLPVHAGDQVRRLLRTKRQIEGQTGRTPTFAELASNPLASTRGWGLKERASSATSLPTCFRRRLSKWSPRRCSAARSKSCCPRSMHARGRSSASASAWTGGTLAPSKRSATS